MNSPKQSVIDPLGWARACVLAVSVILLGYGVGSPLLLAQTEPVLHIQLYAGLSVTGTVGKVYQV